MVVGSRARVCALVSGGLDSLLLVRCLLGEGAVVHPLYVRCGLIWESAELWWLRRWLQSLHGARLKPLTILEAPLRSLYGQHWSLRGRHVPSSRSPDRAVYLPGRNVVLMSHAAVYATQHEISTLAMGLLRGNPFGDATPVFFKRFAECLSQALSQPIRVKMPLRARTKAKWIAAAADQPLGLTFSCIHPMGRRHCGRCNKCAERQRAFRAAHLPDPTQYAR